MMGDAADDLAHFEYRQANPLVWHDEEDEVTDKPKVLTREEWDEAARNWPIPPTMFATVNALWEYRERTRGFNDGCDCCVNNEAGDIAEELGLE